ncbi:hypothetical protein KJ359_001583 [Pestalotiopsis sp. 9143b]|nr:hypothetical protein KJ359_001583 [Pestalotiopsis sp. 9143b]
MCIRYLHSFLCCQRDCGTEIGHENRDIYCLSAERAGVFGQCAGGAALVAELEHYGLEACERCKSRSEYVSPPPETVMEREEDGDWGSGRGGGEELTVEEREQVEQLKPEEPDELEAKLEKEKLEKEKLEKEEQKPRGRVKSPPSPPVGRASAIKIDTTKKWSGPPIFEFAFETALKEQVEEFEKRSSVRKRKSSPDVADDGREWLEAESPTKPSPRRVSKKAKRDARSNRGRPSLDQYGF